MNKPHSPQAAQATEARHPEELGRHVITYAWTTSRGRDTYGYNLLTLRQGGERVARQCGGGYDMTGAAVADWMGERYPVRLAQLARTHAGATYSKAEGYKVKERAEGLFYGLTYYPDNDSASFDRACGLESVKAVLLALGLEFCDPSSNFDLRRGKGGRLDRGVFFVSPPSVA